MKCEKRVIIGISLLTIPTLFFLATIILSDGSTEPPSAFKTIAIISLSLLWAFLSFGITNSNFDNHDEEDKK